MKTGKRWKAQQFIRSKFARTAGSLLAGLVLTGSTALQAAITGQWDFTAGDLSATKGLDLQYADGSGGATEQATVFGTTTTLGLPSIGGEAAHVMGFPKSLPGMGYNMFPNMQANGGGTFVNQYTLIFDLLYPPNSSGSWRALVQIDNSADADLFINAAGGIGISGTYQGKILTNTWHRVAFVFDLTSSTLRKYIDGAFVGQQTLSAGVDGRWSMNPVGGAFGDSTGLFMDDNEDGSDIQPGFVSSIQVHDEALSAAYIQALGAATSDSIPTNVVVPVSVVSQKPVANAMNVNPGSAVEVVLADGSTPLNTASIVLKLNDQVLTKSVTSAAGQHTVTATLPTLSPRSTNTLTLAYTDPGLGAASNQWSFRTAAYVLDGALQQEFTNNTAAYWKLDDGLTNATATLMVDSVGENHCTVTAGLPDYWLGASAAKFGGALHVDGQNVYSLVLPSSSLDIGTNALTLSLWVKLEQLPSQLPASYGSIYDSVGDEYVLYLDKGNKELRFKVTLTNGQAARPGIPESKLITNQWVHIVAVYDGKATATNGEARIYMNGELMDRHIGHDGAVGTGLTANVKPGQTAALGRTGADASNFYVGGIDDFGIWRSSLSVDAIGYLSSGHAVPAVDADVNPLTIVTQPQSKSALLGSRVTFEVVRSGGTPPVTYQWKHDGVNIEGATTTKLNVRVADATAAGTYTVVLQDSVRSVTSDPAVLTVLTLPSDPAESLLWGLAAHWKMDDGLSNPTTQLLDDAQGTNDAGFFGGSAAAWLSGAQARFGGALKLDGTNVFAVVTNSATMDINANQVTLSLWTRLDKMPADLPGSFGGIFDSVADNYVVYLDRGNQELRFKVTTTDSQAARPGIPAADLVLDQWLNVVAVYDGNAGADFGEARIYLNGVLKDTHSGHDGAPGTGLTGNVLPGQLAGIGRNGAAAESYFSGAVDDIGVWNRALSAAEITYLSSGQAIPSAGVPLAISGAKIQGGQIVIQWSGGKGPYQLQRRPSLTQGSWENVGNTTTGTSASDTVEAGNRFYRVVGQ